MKRFENYKLNDRELIDGSGLFFYNSDVPNNKKLEIVKWYKNLDKKEQEYVDILRKESSDETEHDMGNGFDGGDWE